MYTYDLPRERIAQRPVHPYDAAKLLVVDRKSGALTDSTFNEIVKFLNPEDTLVFNNSKVIKARLLGKFVESGGQVELLLLRSIASDRWIALGKPLNRIESGDQIAFGEHLRAHALRRMGALEIEIQFTVEGGSGDLMRELECAGIMPIPPYIRKGRADSQDEIDYQTNFAELSGSIAAPTASLHFTPELMQQIRAAGCSVEFVTLHVGPASFLPLFKEGEEPVLPKTPGAENFVMDSALIQRLNSRRREGRRVIAVGTTVVRALESMAHAKEGESVTELFITPGYKFSLVDSVITNFHQPATTHLLLVESLMGAELLASSYQHALASDYRFLSYGDGMMVV